MEQKLIKVNNPALARKIVWFGIASFALVFLAWGVNLAVLIFNLLMSDMSWTAAVIIFCVVWMAISLFQRTVMVSIGKRLTLEVNKE